MSKKKIQEILGQFPQKRIAVFGDFFLDRYLVIDPQYDELSIETGKTAYQIVDKRLQPGAAGTVCNNLHALGVGEIIALSILGDDGEGYDLRKALSKRKVTTENLLITEERWTPTYTKPMRIQENGEVELNREDQKNRVPVSPELEKEIIARLECLMPQVDAVIIADQVQERNCGVITDQVREMIAAMARKHPRVVFFADSRERIGAFRDIMIKPNRFEATRCFQPDFEGEPSTSTAMEAAIKLREQNQRPVFLTLDREGICPVSEESQPIIPCPPVTEEIDIVGAGDSVTAGIVASMVSQASPSQAAVIGNLVASITIRQLGTTGTASPEQVMEAWEKNQALYAEYF